MSALGAGGPVRRAEPPSVSTGKSIMDIRSIEDVPASPEHQGTVPVWWLFKPREMREETGYDGDDVVPIGVIHPNPAIQPNRCHSFLARDVKPVTTVSFDSTEECEVVLVPLDEIPELIRRGVITHALVVVAFHHLLLAGNV